MDQSHSLSHIRKYTLFQVTGKNGSGLGSYFKSYYKPVHLCFHALTLKLFLMAYLAGLRLLCMCVHTCAWVRVCVHVYPMCICA